MLVGTGDPLYFPEGRKVRIMISHGFTIETKRKIVTTKPSSFLSRVSEIKVSRKSNNISLVKSLVFSTTGIKVVGGIKKKVILRNVEKIISDIRRELKIADRPLVPTEIRNGKCVSALLTTEYYGNVLATGIIISADGERAVVSPALIPPVISGMKRIIGDICVELNDGDEYFTPVNVLKPLFNENPFINTGEYLFVSRTGKPKRVRLSVSLRSAGVVRPWDSMIGVDKVGIYDHPGTLEVSFIPRPLPTPVFSNCGKYTVTFTPDELSDKRVFSLAVGLGFFEKVKSGAVKVRAEKPVKNCNQMVFRIGRCEVAMCVVGYEGGSGKSYIQGMDSRNEIERLGVFDKRVVKLRPAVKSFPVGVMESEKYTFVPVVFEPKRIKGYLVDREEQTINRAVIII